MHLQADCRRHTTHSAVTGPVTITYLGPGGPAIDVRCNLIYDTSLSVSARYRSLAEHLNSSVAVRLLQGIFTPAGR